MANTSAAKRKTKSKKPSPTDKEQSDRFIKAARDLGIDGAVSNFDEALAKLLNQRRKPGKQ